MPPSELERLNQILDHALSLPPTERAAYLEEACHDNADLRDKIESLMAGIDIEVPEEFLKPSPENAKLLKEVYHTLKSRRKRER